MINFEPNIQGGRHFQPSEMTSGNCLAELDRTSEKLFSRVVTMYCETRRTSTSRYEPNINIQLITQNIPPEKSLEWVTYLHEAKNSPKIFDYNTKTAISELLTDAQHIANKKATEVELERIKLERKKIKLETESIRLNTEKMKLKTEEMKIGFKQDKIKRFRLSRQVMLAVGIGMIACGIALFLLLTMTGLIATGIGSIIGFIIGFIVGCAVGGGASIGIHTIATWLRNHFLGEKEKDSDENQSNHAFSPCSNQENSFESLYHTPSYPPSYSDYGPLYNPTPPCSNYGFPYNQRNFDYPTVL